MSTTAARLARQIKDIIGTAIERDIQVNLNWPKNSQSRLDGLVARMMNAVDDADNNPMVFYADMREDIRDTLQLILDELELDRITDPDVYGVYDMLEHSGSADVEFLAAVLGNFLVYPVRV